MAKRPTHDLDRPGGAPPSSPAVSAALGRYFAGVLAAQGGEGRADGAPHRPRRAVLPRSAPAIGRADDARLRARRHRRGQRAAGHRQAGAELGGRHRRQQRRDRRSRASLDVPGRGVAQRRRRQPVGRVPRRAGQRTRDGRGRTGRHRRQHRVDRRPARAHAGGVVRREQGRGGATGRRPSRSSGPEYGIRVNALAPGYFETDINRDLLRPRSAWRSLPARRKGGSARMHELDGPLLLLASDASSHMTGAVIAVDGGHLVSTPERGARPAWARRRHGRNR